MLIVALVVVLAVLGVSALGIGLRGVRLDDHPVCRVCRFDLDGLTSPAGCPECGADLAATRRGVLRPWRRVPAVVVGNRRRRKRHVGGGLAAIALAAIGGGALTWAAAKGFNLNTIKPTWLLMLESRAAGTSSGSAAAAELANRLTADALSSDNTRDLVELALSLQADAGRAWSPEWGDLIEVAWTKGLLTPEQKTRYAANALGIAAAMRERMHAGEWAGLELEVRLPRAGRRMYFEIEPALKSVHLAGRPANINTAHGSVSMQGGGGGAGRIGTGVMLDAPVGRHKANIVWSIAVRVGAVGLGEPDATLEFRHDTTVEVVPPEEPLVVVEPDESLRLRVEAAIAASGLRAAPIESGPDAGRVDLTAQVTITNPPVNLAFDVLVRDPASGREWLLGGVVTPESPNHGHTTSIRSALDGFTVRRAEIVLRPSPVRALAVNGIDRIWDGEVVLTALDVAWSEDDDR